MKCHTSQEDLRQQTAETLRQPATRPPEPPLRSPRVGDLLMMTTDDARPDFWLVAERRQDPVASLFLLPTDIDSMCGSSDVALPESSTLGALTVRCAFAIWLEAASIRPLAIAGSLDDNDLTPVRQRLAAIEAGETGTGLDRDTEAELEYRDLVIELTESRRRLVLSAEGGGSPTTAPLAKTRRPSTERQLAAPLAWAASLLLTAAIGLAMGWTWRGHRIGTGAPEVRPIEPLANLPFEWLTAGGRTRDQTMGAFTQVVSLKPDVPYFALFLDVGVGSDETEYRLVIQRQGSEDAWWSGNAQRTGTAEIFVLLPTAGLAKGDYLLSLYAGNEAAQPRFVYPMHLDLDGGEPAADDLP